jgi:hypothetical protein
MLGIEQGDQNNHQKHYNRKEVRYALVIHLDCRCHQKSKKTLINQGLFEVVAGGGIEPPTQGFSVLCSTN